MNRDFYGSRGFLDWLSNYDQLKQDCIMALSLSVVTHYAMEEHEHKKSALVHFFSFL
jgi:hypothetical protein